MPTPTKYDDGQLVQRIMFRTGRRWTEEAHHTDLSDDGFACSASYLKKIGRKSLALKQVSKINQSS